MPQARRAVFGGPGLAVTADAAEGARARGLCPMLSRAIDRTTWVPIPALPGAGPGTPCLSVPGCKGRLRAALSSQRGGEDRVGGGGRSSWFRHFPPTRLSCSAPEARTKACGCEESPHPSSTSSRAPPLGMGSPRYDLLLPGSSGSCCLRAHTWAALFHDGTREPASHTCFSVALPLPLPPPRGTAAGSLPPPRSSRVPAHVWRPSPSAACPLVPS